MSRYKGRASLRLTAIKFPHHVDMMVPEGGFGRLLNAMHQAVRGQSRRENGRDIIRWCFADLGMAMLFQKEFDEDG
jgi:hypothetical protein